MEVKDEVANLDIRSHATDTHNQRTSGLGMTNGEEESSGGEE